MGSPVSRIIAEIFLQKMEEVHYPNMINSRLIKYIGRYNDDISLVMIQHLLQHNKYT